MAFPRPSPASAATFPVGPDDDGTNTYEIDAFGNALTVTNVLDGTNASASETLTVSAANEGSAQIAAVNDVGDKSANLSAAVINGSPSKILGQVDGTQAIQLTADAFALTADDTVSTFILRSASGSTAQVVVSVEDDSTGNFGGSFSASSDPGSTLGGASLAGATGGHTAQISAIADDGNPSEIVITIDAVTAFRARDDAIIIDPATIPAADPHLAGHLYSTAGALFISAG